VPLACCYLLVAGIDAVPGARLSAEGYSLQIMMWSIPIGWINSLTQYALIAVDLQRRITTAFIIAVTVNITANLIFIPQYSYKAAAIVTIFSELVLLIPFGLLLQTALGRLAWLDMIWRPAVAGGAMLAVMLAGREISPVLAFMVAGPVYAGVLLALRPLNAEERAMLTPLLPGRFRRVVET
jgi:O-antigen/teichoic acid export membrane protein